MEVYIILTKIFDNEIRILVDLFNFWDRNHASEDRFQQKPDNISMAFLKVGIVNSKDNYITQSGKLLKTWCAKWSLFFVYTNFFYNRLRIAHFFSAFVRIFPNVI